MGIFERGEGYRYGGLDSNITGTTLNRLYRWRQQNEGRGSYILRTTLWRKRKRVKDRKKEMQRLELLKFKLLENVLAELEKLTMCYFLPWPVLEMKSPLWKWMLCLYCWHILIFNILSPCNIYFNQIWYFKNNKRLFFTLQKNSQPSCIISTGPLGTSRVVILIQSESMYKFSWVDLLCKLRYLSLARAIFIFNL